MKKLFKYLAATLFGAAMTCGMAACSSDVDGPAPVLESIAVDNVTSLTPVSPPTSTTK